MENTWKRLKTSSLLYWNGGFSIKSGWTKLFLCVFLSLDHIFGKCWSDYGNKTKRSVDRWTEKRKRQIRRLVRSVGLMNNLTWHCFTERKPGRGDSSCTDAFFYFFLLGLSVSIWDLLTEAVFYGGVVNRTHAAQGSLYNTTPFWQLQLRSIKTIAPSVSLSSGWAAAAMLWIGLLAHRPGRAVRLLPFPPSSLPVRSSFSPSLLRFLILLLVVLHLFWLWMPSSRTGWTQAGKEVRVGWRTSGRNGRASFLIPCSWAAAWLCVTLWVCYC